MSFRLRRFPRVRCEDGFNNNELKNELSVDICIRRIFLDELAAWTYIVTHQHGEDIVGFGRVFDIYLFQHTGFRIHGSFPQLFRVHFTQTFVTLGVDAFSFLRHICDEMPGALRLYSSIR